MLMSRVQGSKQRDREKVTAGTPKLCAFFSRAEQSLVTAEQGGVQRIGGCQVLLRLYQAGAASVVWHPRCPDLIQTIESQSHLYMWEPLEGSHGVQADFDDIFES